MTVFNCNSRNGKGYRFSKGMYNNMSGGRLNDHGSCDDCDSDDSIEGGKFNFKKWARCTTRKVGNQVRNRLVKLQRIL